MGLTRRHNGSADIDSMRCTEKFSLAKDHREGEGSYLIYGLTW
jgi:hypothetical protein